MEESTSEQKCPLCGKWLDSESLDDHLRLGHKELGGRGLPSKQTPLTVADMQEERIRALEKATDRLKIAVILLALAIVLIGFIFWVF
jgi:hypothetical protein